MKFLDYTGLSSFLDKIKDYISSQVTKENLDIENVENKSSETIRNEITYDNVINALGYVPTSTTELEEVTFSIVDGNLIMYYPDTQVLPVVEVNDAGHLIYTV